MPYSGVYFIPVSNAAEASTTFNAITSSLEKNFENIQPLNVWTLTHRLLRSTPPYSTDKPTQVQLQSQAYHHILNLSYHNPGLTYCYVHPAPPAQPTKTPYPERPQPSNAPQPEGTALIAIPTSQSDSHTLLLTTHLSAQWMIRQTLIITPSPTYLIGEFTVRIGETRVSKTPFPVLGSAPGLQNPIVPGIVVCIEIATETSESPTTSDNDSDSDWSSDSEDDDDDEDLDDDEDDSDDDDDDDDTADEGETSDVDEPFEAEPLIKEEDIEDGQDSNPLDTTEPPNPIKPSPTPSPNPTTPEKKSDSSSGSSTMRAPSDRSTTLPPPTEAEIRVMAARHAVREFWEIMKTGVAELQKDSVREVMMRGVEREEEVGDEDGDVEVEDRVVRMWCEVLRLR